ncbi:MAG: sugar ABC transporter substrate-binding protein, partial [Mesorhizobium sp.]
MSLAKWTVGLLAGMSMLALAAPADAGEVRVTVAEYSAKTGPYFEAVKKEFEAANPGITIKYE